MITNSHDSFIIFLFSAFHTGLGVESREITLRNAKKKITDLAHQMRCVFYFIFFPYASLSK